MSEHECMGEVMSEHECRCGDWKASWHEHCDDCRLDMSMRMSSLAECIRAAAIEEMRVRAVLMRMPPRHPLTPCMHLSTSMFVDGKAQCFGCGATVDAVVFKPWKEQP